MSSVPYIIVFPIGCILGAAIGWLVRDVWYTSRIATVTSSAEKVFQKTLCGCGGQMDVGSKFESGRHFVTAKCRVCGSQALVAEVTWRGAVSSRTIGTFGLALWTLGVLAPLVMDFIWPSWLLSAALSFVGGGLFFGNFFVRSDGKAAPQGGKG